MAFTSPSTKLPKLKPGWIYCIRDEDYLDNSISRYVKLGLTERTVEERIREHQTGNPRREFEAIDSTYLELMHYGENYLHHVFAEDRIGGEWFDMDDVKLSTDVRTVLDQLEAEMVSVAPSFRRWDELADVADNNLTRPATAAEQGWASDFKTAFEQMTVAKAVLDTHKNNLIRMLGNEREIEHVMYINETNNGPRFSKPDFLNLLTPAQALQCESSQTSWSRKLEMLDKGDDLATLNPTVHAAYVASEVGLSSPSGMNMAGSRISLTQTIKDEHMSMLRAMKAVKEAEWACLKAQAKLVEALDDHREIDGVIRWKREQNTGMKWDANLAKQLFETEYNASFRPPSTPYTYKTEYHYMRKYNP